MRPRRRRGLSHGRRRPHKSFCDKYASGAAARRSEGAAVGALGVGQSEWKGNKYWERTDFVVDPMGVRKVYAQVKPDGHEQQVLRDLKELQKSAGR
jgi:peroxiredoxin Q/BCP